MVLETAPLLAEGEVADWVTAEAQDNAGLVGYVLSFPDCDEVEVSVLECEGPQPDAQTRYTKVVEVSVSGGAVLGNDSGESHQVVALNEHGEFRVRMCVDESDAARPVLLLESWPASAAAPVVVRGSNRAEVVSPRLLLPEAAAGLAAAARIGRDVDGGPDARRLTAQDGVAQSSVVLPGKPERLDGYFEKAHVWTPDLDGFMWWYSWALDGPVAFMRHADHPDRLSGWKGALWTNSHPRDHSPHERVVWWNWLVPADGSARVDDDCQMARKLLTEDTIRTATLTQVPGSPAQTRAEIVHTGLPVEWADDMTAWWTYQLAILADMLKPRQKG
ncbi:MAG: hypothetical protein H0X12_07590 [Nocardioides sp.]|nr:hypothetical protein [Nocardioides sp.]